MAVHNDDGAPPRKHERSTKSKSNSKKRKHTELGEEPSKKLRKDDAVTAPLNQPEHDEKILTAEATTDASTGEVRLKKRKKKREGSDKQLAPDGIIPEPTVEQEEDTKSKTAKKKKKKPEKKEKGAQSTTEEKKTEPSILESTTDATVSAQANGSAVSKEQKHRFILFVGNLPYSTTTSGLQSHFLKLKPTAVRHRTDPASGKSKGFAFLEFASFDRMQTCLEKYHHSMYEGRKINMELTAGGGGKGKQRQGRLKEKNERLQEERKKKVEKEKRAKDEKAKERAVEVEKAQDGIHPSRLAMVKV